MKKISLLIGAFAAIALAGCGDDDDTNPLSPTGEEFSMQVLPERIEDVIAGQRCVFLVQVERRKWSRHHLGRGPGRGPHHRT